MFTARQRIKCLHDFLLRGACCVLWMAALVFAVNQISYVLTDATTPAQNQDLGIFLGTVVIFAGALAAYVHLRKTRLPKA